MLGGTRPVAAPFSSEARAVGERGQCIQASACSQYDVAATAAIAAVRTSAWNVLLSTEARDAVSTGASLHEDASFIDKASIRHGVTSNWASKAHDNVSI